MPPQPRHHGACGYCAHWTPRERAPALCRAPEVLPRVIDWDRCRDDPALCGEPARWWDPIPPVAAAEAA